MRRMTSTAARAALARCAPRAAAIAAPRAALATAAPAASAAPAAAPAEEKSISLSVIDGVAVVKIAIPGDKVRLPGLLRSNFAECFFSTSARARCRRRLRDFFRRGGFGDCAAVSFPH
jgi:hypothetical protein